MHRNYINECKHQRLPKCCHECDIDELNAEIAELKEENQRFKDVFESKTLNDMKAESIRKMYDTLGLIDRRITDYADNLTKEK